MIQFPTVSLENVLGVMIDLDNTLYDYDSTHQKAITHCAEQFGQVSIDQFNRDYRHQRTLVTHKHSPTGTCRSRLLAFLGLFESYHCDQAWNLAKTYADLYWQVFYDTIELADQAADFLAACNKQNIPLCLVTDMEMAVQVEKLRALGCETTIRYMVSSEETGQEKPAAIMFETALKKLQLTAPNLKYDTCIMVGDSQSKDIVGAEQLGIPAYKVAIS